MQNLNLQLHITKSCNRERRFRKHKTQKKKVSQDGTVFFGEVGIISVAGKKLSEVKKILEIKINDTLLQTEFYLSLGRIKQINVNIMGEVNRPGVYSISGLASFLDALTLAGGIKKSGSLRNINIINNDKVEKVDLYNFLFQLKNLYTDPDTRA